MRENAKFQTRKLGLLVQLIFLLTLGCSHSTSIEGQYVVRFDWNDRLTRTDISRAGRNEPVPAALRSAVGREVEPIISEQIKRANLVQAHGVVECTLYEGPPDAVFVNRFEITEPDFSKLIGAVALEDTEEIKVLVSRYHNVNQRDEQTQQTALFMAALGGKTKSLEALLSLGADPTIPDSHDKIPKDAAVFAGCKRCVDPLARAAGRMAHQR